MRRLFMAIGVVFILLVFSLPFYLVSQYPELVPTAPVPATPTATQPVKLQVGDIATGTKVPVAEPVLPVNAVITGTIVYIRDGNMDVAGTLQAGESVLVVWREDGWGLIHAPAEIAGNYIWRGCTSDPGPFRCEAK